MRYDAVRHLIAVALATLALAATLPAHAQSGRRAAPDFDAETLDGERVTLSEFEGDVVVISFWATWCRPCLQELPFLDGFREEYADRGLTVLAVSTDGPETRAQVRNMARRFRWGMPVVLDEDGSVSALLNPRGTNPFVVFVDRQGRIAEEHEGYSSGDEVEYEALILELLAEGESDEAEGSGIAPE